MYESFELSESEKRYLTLLAEQFPTQQAAFTEAINLQAILNLPKATEHFISDVHGEYEAFWHILNNCSGVIRDRVEMVLGPSLTEEEIDEVCTLIYYPKEKIAQVKAQGIASREWYESSLMRLIYLARYLSNTYTRSKVRKAMPVSYAYIIDELLHEAGERAPERHFYHERIIDSILDNGAAEDFIESLAQLNKRLAVDHLHLVGDIWDRGAHGDRIVDALMGYHLLDIQWGNHDVTWMGAAAGSEICMASVVYTNVRNKTLSVLESAYGISLRELALLAERSYHYEESNKKSLLEKAIAVILFKLEGQVICRRLEFDMEDRLLLDKVNPRRGTVTLAGKEYELNTHDFPTLDPVHPFELSPEEREVVAGLMTSFRESARLHAHINFLYEVGSMYTVANDNLIFHGCIPMNEDGSFRAVHCGQDLMLSGRRYLDFTDQIARRAWYEHDPEALDWMWYLGCGKLAPTSGRIMKTFERAYIIDQETWTEPQDPYWKVAEDPAVCEAILREFDISPRKGHIINGHTPVKADLGETPIRADGKFLIIDGGFCKKYHIKTGTAGYTLVYDDEGMRLKTHEPFESIEAALEHNADIDVSRETIITHPTRRLRISDTDTGEHIRRQIADLQNLLAAYRTGEIAEHVAIS